MGGKSGVQFWPILLSKSSSVPQGDADPSDGLKILKTPFDTSTPQSCRCHFEVNVRSLWSILFLNHIICYILVLIYCTLLFMFLADKIKFSSHTFYCIPPFMFPSSQSRLQWSSSMSWCYTSILTWEMVFWGSNTQLFFFQTWRAELLPSKFLLLLFVSTYQNCVLSQKSFDVSKCS